MSSTRISLAALATCVPLLLTGCGGPGPAAPAAAPPAAAPAAAMGNPISGVGMPNPAPTVTRNWGTLPAGRKWGTSAGIDIDPKDGQVWAYERCGDRKSTV